MLVELVVTVELSIASEKVTDTLSVTETPLWLSVGEMEEIVGAVVSITNELIFNVTLLPEESVTEIVQSEYVPALKETKVIVLLSVVVVLSVVPVAEYSSLSSLQEMTVRLKQKISKMNNPFFIFSSIPKVKSYWLVY